MSKKNCIFIVRGSLKFNELPGKCKNRFFEALSIIL
jgi:hypothetical protein